jgi:hypothetical protein
MRSIHTWLLLIPVAALVQSCSLFGSPGNPLDDLRQAIERTVDDQARATAMLESLDRSDQLMLRSAKVLADGAIAQRRLFADYDSTPADFDDLFNEVSNNRQRLQREMLLEHIRFKSAATADEWSALADIHSRAVDARAEALARSAIAAARS